jgi:hypothetical protein
VTNADLFEEALADDLPTAAVLAHDACGAPAQQELGIARSHGRRPRPAGSPGTEDPHFRLAMRAARRLPRSERRDQTRRLICHHLRCMLEDEADAMPRRRHVTG